MKSIISWLWLIPVPLGFLFELAIGSGPLVMIANVLAILCSVPVLTLAQAKRDIRHVWISVGGLLASLVLIAVADTFGLLVLWLSMTTLVLLARHFTSRWQLGMMIVLGLANIIAPGLAYGEGLTFAFAASTMIIASAALGLLLRMFDKSLVERHETAIETERRRMATELHDVVAHEVSGIVVLSQAAARTDDLTVLHGALAKIEESGSLALEEIRSLVSTVDTDSAQRVPVASGPQSLEDRVQNFAAGEERRVDYRDTVDEDHRSRIPAAAWPALDRVLLEALTNVRRHTHTLAPVSIHLGVQGAQADGPLVLSLTVVNESVAGGIGPGSGTGLSGLRHRMSRLGGELLAGRLPDGRWQVQARIPLS